MTLLSRIAAAGLLLALAASCTSPPPEAFVAGVNRRDARPLDLGSNASGEPCALSVGGTEAQIYCGSYVEPAGRVQRLAQDGDARTVVADSAWRRGFDQRFVCTAPTTTTVLSAPAEALRCSRRQGGWPHAALVARVGNAVYAADGVQPAESVLAQAIGVMSGALPATPLDALDTSGRETQRQAAQATTVQGAGAIAEVEFQISRGGLENRRGNFAAAEAAYRAAATIQEKVLGPTNPALAVTLARLALQVSNQGRFDEAERLFARAERLAAGPDQVDPVAKPMVAYLHALIRLNAGQPAQALRLLDTAEAGFAAIVPREALVPRGRASVVSRSAVEQMADDAANAALMANPSVAEALNALIETRRYRAVALSALGRTAEAEAALEAARDLYLGRDPRLTARYLRTTGMTLAAAGRPGAAASELGAAASTFARIQPRSLPVAETQLLQAGELVAAGNAESALPLCRAAGQTLQALQVGLPPDLFVACLRAFDQAGRNAGPDAVREMFAISQLAQGSITTRQIARATARLAEGAKDSRVAEAMRLRDLAGQGLDVLYLKRAELAAEREKSQEIAAVDEEIRKAQEALADASQAVQAAAPRLGGLVQESVSLAQVQAVMAPSEAVAAVVLGERAGWTFLIRRDSIVVGRIQGGAERIDRLVKRIRTTMDLGSDNRPPRFDAAAARELYAAVLGPVEPAMAGAVQLTVSATGSLLSVPFSLLLTGQGGDDDLARAPFLVRRMAVAHVPSVGGFVNLRKSAGTVRAARPWFGLGEFRPPSARQAAATFPSSGCGDSARLLASLSPLPGARRELEAARVVLGADASDQLLGAAFTAPRVLAQPLAEYRTLHFATHAVLPSELRCQAEPAVLTSTPPEAPDAAAAMLTASQIERMNLDADLVILAACNTGGGSGGAGESLSGLARSFFFAGARSLMVTHWEANDVTTTYLTVLFLQNLQTARAAGPAAALAKAQVRMLDESVGARAEQAHPYYWAVGALIGGEGPATL